jgi:hypothetical protein
MQMAYNIEIYTPANPQGVMVGPKGLHARPYVYETHDQCSLAMADIKAGLHAAGVDIDMDIVYRFVPAKA